MDIKKGLSYVAFGFLFTLVNFNLTLNGGTVNVMPDFVGWILFFLAFDKLGTYISDKKYMKWISLILAVVTAALWILGMAKPELDVDVFNTLAAVVSAVYMFILFGVLENIARDYKSSRAETIRMLKILNLVLYVAFMVLALAYYFVKEDALAVITAFIGITMLVAAIFTAFVLFALRKEVKEYTPEEA